jgi:hypothetical protein
MKLCNAVAVFGHSPKILTPADNVNVPSTQRAILCNIRVASSEAVKAILVWINDYYAQPGVYYTQQTVSNLHPVCRIKRSRHLDLALFASKAAALIKFQTQTVFAVADTRLMYKLNNRVEANIAFAAAWQPGCFCSPGADNINNLHSVSACVLESFCCKLLSSALASCVLSRTHMWWEWERTRARNNFAKRVLFLLRVKLLPLFPFQYEIVASRAPTLVLFKNNTLRALNFPSNETASCPRPKINILFTLEFGAGLFSHWLHVFLALAKHLRRYYICQWACTWLGSHRMLVREKISEIEEPQDKMDAF